MGSGKTNIRFSRKTMVDRQIARRGITDKNILSAMETVPREAFLPDDMAAIAYEDMPAPIGEGQTISQPYIVAKMAELAELKATDKVLEVGTGSGYGAAVLSRIVAHVHTIERHPVLATNARHVIKQLGYDNIYISEGDGTLGLPDSAPFDAIVVTAGAPDVPEILQQQLAVGGRLVIPAGDSDSQLLLLIRRTAENTFTSSEHGAVRFVPLIGQHGWETEHRLKPSSPNSSSKSYQNETQMIHSEVDRLRSEATKLPAPDSVDFARHFSHLADAKVVLLGEASHGTAEFYQARAAITRYLVSEHGFNIIALEADWPDVAVLDGYVRDRKVPAIGQPAFSRFPQWMWRNEEFRALLPWLRERNRQQEKSSKTALYGLDMYSMQASLHAIIDYLEKKDPELAKIAKDQYGCFKPWLEDPAAYGNTVVNADFIGCEKQALEMLIKLMNEREVYSDGYEDAYLDVIRNAMTVTSAEQYYRVMYRGSAESWNLRDTHMFDTLKAVLSSRGDHAKAIVWAHNSHLGDARATEMGKRRKELNLGQLCREEFGNSVRLVGFGTATGTVAAARHWGGKMEVKTVQDPVEGSIEKLWQETGLPYATLNMSAISKSLREELEKDYLERAIGVIYRPETELISHYFNSAVAKQFDDYIWFNKTGAVTPLPPIEEHVGAETYPFGL